MMRRKYLCGAALLVAMFVAFAPQPAFAQSLHAILLRSDPSDTSVLTEPPTMVRLWFSEQVQLVGQSIQVLSPSGAPLKLGGVHERGLELSVPVRATQTGTYLVTWQVISQDTDPVSGSFIFSVRHSGGVWATTSGSSGSLVGFWLQVSAHLLHFLGFALAFGSVAFLRLVLIPLQLTDSEVMQRLRRIAYLGIAALLLAEGGALLAQVVSLDVGALPIPDIIGAVLASNFGRVMAQRMGAAILLWIFMGMPQQHVKIVSNAALSLGVVLACIDGEASHAFTSRMVVFAMLTNTLHVAAMGAWAGGLLTLLVLWNTTSLKPRRSMVVMHFGRLAMIAVVELVLTGVLLSWLYVARPSNLLTTRYGGVLVLKVCALFIPLLFAFVSRRKHEELRSRWWIGESIALSGILLLAATLISLPPP